MEESEKDKLKLDRAIYGSCFTFAGKRVSPEKVKIFTVGTEKVLAEAIRPCIGGPLHGQLLATFNDRPPKVLQLSTPSLMPNTQASMPCDASVLQYEALTYRVVYPHKQLPAGEYDVFLYGELPPGPVMRDLLLEAFCV